MGGTANLGFAVFFKNALADNVKHGVKSVLLETPCRLLAGAGELDHWFLSLNIADQEEPVGGSKLPMLISD